jgi:hypothetical protein
MVARIHHEPSKCPLSRVPEIRPSWRRNNKGLGRAILGLATRTGGQGDRRHRTVSIERFAQAHFFFDWLAIMYREACGGNFMVGVSGAQIRRYENQGYLVPRAALDPTRALAPILDEYSDILDVLAEAIPRDGHVNRYDPGARMRWSLDLRHRRTGQPSGRALLPRFIALSHGDPERECRDHAAWVDTWHAARAHLAGLGAVPDGNRWIASQSSTIKRSAAR